MPWNKCKKHRFPSISRPTHERITSNGSVKVFCCDNCLTVKVVQQRTTEWTQKDKRVETIVELDSAYPEAR